MKGILLTNEFITYVSDEDYEFIIKWSWSYMSNGNLVRRRETIENKVTTIFMHIVIAKRMGLIIEPDLEVDHKDRNGLNNTRENLRLVTKSQNNINQGLKSTNLSNYKGVSFHKASNKWVAQINHEGTKIYLGVYNTPEKAAKAYDSAAKQLFGEFAYLNFQKKDD